MDPAQPKIREARVVPPNESSRKALEELVMKRREAERRKNALASEGAACGNGGSLQSPSLTEMMRGLSIEKENGGIQPRRPGASGVCEVEPFQNVAQKIASIDLGSDDEEEVLPPTSKKTVPTDFVLGDGEFLLPGTLAAGLYPHQREGIQWMWGLHKMGRGGILGDDMGLGKTRQVASFIAGLFRSKLTKRVLLVLPSTLIRTWETELDFVGLKHRVHTYVSTVGKGQRDAALARTLQSGGVLLTTYEMVPGHAEALCGLTVPDVSHLTNLWDYLILDEGHRVKNPSTKSYQGLKKLSYSHCILMTGTPLQNHMKELWALFNLCCEGLLGEKTEFREIYEKSITFGSDKNASAREKLKGNAAAENLRKKIAPFLLRRLKADICSAQSAPSAASSSAATPNFSKKTDLIVWLPLTQRQRNLYHAFLNSEHVKAALNQTQSALAAITVLKKICVHPSLLNENAVEDIVEGVDNMNIGRRDAGGMKEALEMMRRRAEGEAAPPPETSDSCKIDFLIILLEELVRNGHRVLIFSEKRTMLDIVQKEIEKRKVKFCRIDGTVPPQQRSQQVDEFQNNPRIPFFLLTSQVGGVGLTLTGADRVVIMDPSWNPTVDDQSVDRAYRIGQKRDVVVYRLITAGTVEEKIYRKQIFKGGLMKTATEEKEQLRYFSSQDLADLFKVPEHGFDVCETQKHLHALHADQQQLPSDLESHVAFLQRQKIVGMSVHNLLFSKEAPPLPDLPEQPELLKPHSPRSQGSGRYVTRPGGGGNLSASSHYRQGETRVSGEAGRASSSASEAVPIEFQRAREQLLLSRQNVANLQTQIERLQAILHNPSVKLPDGGASARKKIRVLEEELRKAESVKQSMKALISAFTMQ